MKHICRTPGDLGQPDNSVSQCSSEGRLLSSKEINIGYVISWRPEVRLWCFAGFLQEQCLEVNIDFAISDKWWREGGRGSKMWRGCRWCRRGCVKCLFIGTVSTDNAVFVSTLICITILFPLPAQYFYGFACALMQMHVHMNSCKHVHAFIMVCAQPECVCMLCALYSHMQVHTTHIWLNLSSLTFL